MRDFVRTELEGQGGRSFSSADHTHSSNSSIILEQLSPRLLNESNTLPPVSSPTSLKPPSSQHCFSKWPLCNLGYCYKNCPTDSHTVDNEPVEKIVIKMSDVQEDVVCNGGDEDGENEVLPLEERLSTYIYENLMGRESTFKGPFGRKQVVYADLVSTGRSLRFLEDFMMNDVLPSVSDSQAMTTVTGLQSMLYLDETRNIIRQAVNSGGDDHLIFGGATSGSYVNGGFGLESVGEHIHGLGLPIVIFADIRIDERRWPWPWMLSSNDENITVIDIPQTEDGAVDIAFLKKELEKYSGREEFVAQNGHQLIGCFASASRLNGVLQNDLEITALLHIHGALAFWDYSTAGPYCVINMNPEVPDDNEGLYRKDLIFFSGDNFVGGMQTCGIAIVKRALLRLSNYSINGGSMDTKTVSLGEPIRAGLAVQLKESIGGKYIMEKHKEISQNIQEKLDDLTTLIMLGKGNRKFPNKPKHPHLTTISFVVREPNTGLYLHHNFICSVLNDLFGIQARGTSALTTKQSRYIFGLQNESSQEQYSVKLSAGNPSPRDVGARQNVEVLKPGYVTIDLPWFAPEEEISFILYAIRMVAEDGWKLLPQYLFNLESGEWLHHSNPAMMDRKSLQKICYGDGSFHFEQAGNDTKTTFNLYDTLLKAKEIIKNAKKVASNLPVPDQESAFNSDAQRLRWFLLPTEAQKQLCGSSWSKMKKISVDKLNIRASSGETPPPPQLKPKKGKKDKKEDKTDEPETEVVPKEPDCYNPFGSLAGDKISPIPALGDTTRRQRSKASWLTRQITEEEKEENTISEMNELDKTEENDTGEELDGENVKTEEENNHMLENDGSRADESEEIEHTDSVSNIDESEEYTSNEKPVKEGTWVSRFLGNKKSSSKPEKESTNAVQINDDKTEENEFAHSEVIQSSDAHEDKDERRLENSDESRENEDVVSYGELSTIPEGKEEEEAQEEETTQDTEVPDKAKKKGLGFSSFLTKFGIVSAATKQLNEGKHVKEEAGVDSNGQENDKKDAYETDESEKDSSSVNVEDQNGSANPVQQYVFGWDEDEASKNRTSNDHKKFQETPPVSVPVA